MSKQIILLGLVAVSIVSAASDCNTVPSGTDSSWCGDCDKQPTRNNGSCTYCSPSTPYSIFSGASCSAQNCNSTPSTYTAEYCRTCAYFGPNVYLRTDGSGCTDQNCASQPGTVTNSWCSACHLTNFYANHDGSECIEENCLALPSKVTDEICASCSATDTKASADGTTCIEVDCDVLPTGNYTDDWCNVCGESKKFALTDKSACGVSSSTTATSKNASESSTTNGSILSTLISFTFLLVNLL